MIGRVNRIPAPQPRGAGRPHVRPCIQGDPTCNTHQGCGCYNKVSPAQKAAVEKSLAPYFKLSCGHFESREVAILFSVFAEHIKDVYCERCNKFTTIMRSDETGTYPQNPLF